MTNDNVSNNIRITKHMCIFKLLILIYHGLIKRTVPYNLLPLKSYIMPNQSKIKHGRPKKRDLTSKFSTCFPKSLIRIHIYGRQTV